MTGRPPYPPFTLETARQKVQAAEDGWNTRDPQKVALAYTEDSQWRNRDTFVTGRAAIDVAIDASERRIFGSRPESERGADFPLR